MASAAAIAAVAPSSAAAIAAATRVFDDDGLRALVALFLDLTSVLRLVRSGLLIAQGPRDPMWGLLLGRAMRFPIVRAWPLRPRSGEPTRCYDGRLEFLSNDDPLYVAQIAEERPSAWGHPEGIAIPTSLDVLLHLFCGYQHCAIDTPDPELLPFAAKLRDSLLHTEDMLSEETDRASALEEDLATIADQRDELQCRAEALEAERDELRCRAEALEAERDELLERASELEYALAR